MKLNSKIKLNSRQTAIEDELKMLLQLSGGEETPRIKELMAQYKGDISKLMTAGLYWELTGNDDALGSYYRCPTCGFNTPEEAFWSEDFAEFNPLPFCPKCNTRLKA